MLVGSCERDHRQRCERVPNREKPTEDDRTQVSTIYQINSTQILPTAVVVNFIELISFSVRAVDSVAKELVPIKIASAGRD